MVEKLKSTTANQIREPAPRKQTKDPRNPKDVLTEEGIHPHPGPNVKKEKTKTPRTRRRSIWQLFALMWTLSLNGGSANPKIENDECQTKQTEAIKGKGNFAGNGTHLPAFGDLQMRCPQKGKEDGRCPLAFGDSQVRSSQSGKDELINGDHLPTFADQQGKRSQSGIKNHSTDEEEKRLVENMEDDNEGLWSHFLFCIYVIIFLTCCTVTSALRHCLHQSLNQAEPARQKTESKCNKLICAMRCGKG